MKYLGICQRGLLKPNNVGMAKTATPYVMAKSYHSDKDPDPTLKVIPNLSLLFQLFNRFIIFISQPKLI